MPKRIPIKVARDVAKATQCRQVILLAWDGERSHVVTYGKTIDDCDQAAQGGNMLKKHLGWPDDLLNAVPRRVKALQDRIAQLEAELASERQGRLFGGVQTESMVDPADSAAA